MTERRWRIYVCAKHGRFDPPYIPSDGESLYCEFCGEECPPLVVVPASDLDRYRELAEGLYEKREALREENRRLGLCISDALAALGRHGAGTRAAEMVLRAALEGGEQE